MSVEMRAYDNEHGDPVVVLVTTGTYDVSRLVGLLAKGRCEDHDLSKRVQAAVQRHNGGRSALRLLRDHGGPDFTQAEASSPDDPQTAPSSRGTGVLSPGGDGRNAPTVRPPLGAQTNPGEAS